VSPFECIFEFGKGFPSITAGHSVLLCVGRIDVLELYTGLQMYGATAIQAYKYRGLLIYRARPIEAYRYIGLQQYMPTDMEAYSNTGLQTAVLLSCCK
jgi:hypothetical protein